MHRKPNGVVLGQSGREAESHHGRRELGASLPQFLCSAAQQGPSMSVHPQGQSQHVPGSSKQQVAPVPQALQACRAACLSVATCALN